MPYKYNPVTGKLDYYEAGSGSANLSTVLANGNTSGPNDIQFDATQGVLFNNGSRLREGTIDGMLGGSKGIAQICAVGYELKWEAGRLYVMDGNGIYIRWSLYNFTITPTITDDVTLGYLIGSRWSLDDGTTYVCTDNTIGAAVWEIQEVNYIDFNKAAAHIVAEGELAWNDSLGTLDLGLKGGNTISNLGQHIHARVVNKTTPLVGLTKAGYEVVVVAGATGQRLSVKLAKADSDLNSAGTLGIVCENIAGNQEGFICSVGQVTNINTTGSLQGETWADGDSLYLSGTTFGAITNVKPSAPIHEVRIGYVEYAHAVHGKIYVKIDNGYELEELHNVSITSEANNDALVYETSTQLWKNKTIGGWSYIVKSANQDVTNNATLQDDTELQFSVVAGGQYMVELDAVISANNTTGDYTNAFFVNSGTMKGQGIQTCNTATAVAQVVSINTNAANVSTVTQMGTLIADIDMISSIKIIYSFTASANAVFSYRFSNAAAAAGRISRTWKGSILKYKKIN
jgi:hypothetical protein